jgi:hypothetical protein
LPNLHEYHTKKSIGGKHLVEDLDEVFLQKKKILMKSDEKVRLKKYNI